MAGRDLIAEGPLVSAGKTQAGASQHTAASPAEFWIPTGLGFTAALLILAFSGLAWAGTSTAVLFLASSVAIGAWRARLAQGVYRREQYRARGVQHESGSLRDLCLRFFPIWGRQIDTSRSTADEAVGDLARNFAAMVERLDTTLAASKSAVTDITGREGSIVDVVRHGEADLASVVSTLRNLQQSKQTILGQVTEYAKHLQEMAADVQKIALQIRLLSLNGAIEAARAGEAGKAFAVVVGEMHRLSMESSAIGTKISKNVASVNATVSQLVREADAKAGNEVALIAKAEGDISGVMGKFKGLTTGLSQSVRTMEQESEALKAQIADALVSLQFQDRVSQIMAHTAQSLEAVRAAVAQHADIGSDLDAWLLELSRGYTTQEEFDNLRASTRGAARHGAQRHEVTFF